MNFVVERAKKYLEVIESTIRTNKDDITDIEICEGKEKPSAWIKYNHSRWGGDDKW